MDSASLIFSAGAVIITVLLYALFQIIYKRWLSYSLTHPLIVTSLFMALVITQSPYSINEYQQAAAILHWCLGPVTVALAVPLYQQWQAIRRQGLPLLSGILFGGVIAPILAWLSVWALDAPLTLQLTLLAKSVTTPLAMDASAAIGGEPALAAVFVIVTGIVGATAADLTFRFLRVSDKQAQGIALGTVAHAIGTAKAVSDDPETGACASMALCLNGLMTVIILPLLF